MIFPIPVLYCVYNMLKNKRIFCHGHDLIITAEGLTCIHCSKNSKAAIQWCSLKYEDVLKSHPV